VPSPRVERFTTGTRVWYGLDGRFGTWSVSDRPSESLEALTGVGEHAEVWTYLRGAGDADVLARRHQRAALLSTVDIDFAESGSLLAVADIGSLVVVTYDPAPSASGAYARRVCALTRLERGYAPVLTVRGQLRDVDLLLNRVGRWSGPAEPNYASASAAQRAVAGYWGGTASSLGWQ